MLNRKWTVYVIHHSHTDIGYTDLQEKIIYNHIDYIKHAVKVTKEGREKGTVHKNFKWNCETYFCVEKFLEVATESEKNDFYEMIKSNNIGLSATYLNFTDLVDKNILDKRTKEMVEHFNGNGIQVKTAMNADVNGVSLGTLDVLIKNGIEFFFTNIHCHHGMYPLYQNQKPFYWENKEGEKILVYSGEHYNLGNVLEILENKNPNFLTENYSGGKKKLDGHLALMKEKISDYLTQVDENGYDYDFIPVGVSGVFSDNAPPNTDIIENIKNFNEKYGDEIRLEMVTLQEFYNHIKDKVKDAPVYKGDLNDWWSHGVGSTPYPVKHYREAQRMHRLYEQLNQGGQIEDVSLRDAETNLMLYAEHTWGHSSTITNPYDTMVLNLDTRKNSYASKAHEEMAKALNVALHHKGDKLRYYDRSGKVKSINPTAQSGKMLVEFYIEVWGYSAVEVKCNKTKEELITQISPHPRGVLISFIDHFEAHEEKVYSYCEVEKKIEVTNSRVAHVGSERVKDIVNDHDPITYKLPYQLENDFFKIEYEIGKGVQSFFNKVDNFEMLKEGDAKFFTPIYENTSIRTDVYEERRLLGRNIRGLHARKHVAELIEIKIIETGDIFSSIELVYKLEGTYFSSVVIKMYHNLPKIDFKYKIAKTLSMDVEGIFLPLTINNSKSELYIDKGDVSMRPGVDQIPGTGMEYYLVDNGLVYNTGEHAVVISTLDAPLIYTGEMKHHAIKLCNNAPENNTRDVYSWIMNNVWETNFKMDLSGISEFCYSLELVNAKNVDDCFAKMKDSSLGVVSFMIEDE